MNEPSSSFWRKPWQGPRALLAWMGLLALASFLVIFCYSLLLSKNASFSDLLLSSLASGVGIAVVFTGVVLFVQWLRRPPHLRWFAFALACLATVLALACAEENWRGARAWKKYRAEGEARGEKFNILPLTPPAVPDDKNFAMAPLLKPVLDYTQGTTGIVWGDTNGQARLRELSPSLPVFGSTNQLVLGSLEKGTFADLPACATFYRGNTNYPQAPANSSPAETILIALDRFNPELKQLRDASTARPFCRFPIHYEYQPCWAILLPHLAPIKGLTQLVHARAVAELELGRPAEAMNELRLGFRFSDAVHDEPLLISHLVRLAALAIDLQTIREGLERHAWTESELLDMQTNLASLNLLAEHQLAMKGEQAFSAEGLEYLRRQSFRMTEEIATSGPDDDSLSSVRFFPGGWYYQNILTICRMLHQYSFPAVDEQARRVYPEVTDKGTEALSAMRRNPYTIFAKMLLPALAKPVERSARVQTYVDCAQIACALERYRMANGSLPESLDDLVPKFISRIPNDVIDGKPLRYVKNPDTGYLLYSVGWNQTDDHGKIILTKETAGKKKQIDSAQGDWVWTMPK